MFPSMVLIASSIKILPVYAEQRQIIFDVDEVANKAAVRNLKEDEVKKAIETLRTKYSLPEGSITVESVSENRAKISIDYTRVIDLLVTSYDWKVNFTANGKAI